MIQKPDIISYSQYPQSNMKTAHPIRTQYLIFRILYVVSSYIVNGESYSNTYAPTKIHIYTKSIDNIQDAIMESSAPAHDVSSIEE